MSGLLLRLAAPLQSWGERSTFDTRDTAGFPTRSGLLGLLACTQGYPRGADLQNLAPLEFTIRIDRPGTRVIDYHTSGGALPSGQKIPTADGKGRPEGKGTLQTWREYLADAVFVVAITGPDPVLSNARQALRAPHWQPFLGRRSCPPNQPLLLDIDVDDAVAELHERVPVAQRVGSEGTDLSVDFIYPSGLPEKVRSEIHDIPTRFTRTDRHYRPRPIWRDTCTLSAQLGVPSLAQYPSRLATYLRGKE